MRCPIRLFFPICLAGLSGCASPRFDMPAEPELLEYTSGQMVSGKVNYVGSAEPPRVYAVQLDHDKGPLYFSRRALEVRVGDKVRIEYYNEEATNWVRTITVLSKTGTLPHDE